jgi:hypothetical protein
MGAPDDLSAAGVTPDRFGALVDQCRPVVLRGLVGTWPAVTAGVSSPAAFRDYLARFDNGGRMDAFFGEPGIAGKYYYGEGLKGFNFERRRVSLRATVDAMIAGLDDSAAETVYAGSVPVADFLPGFAADNPMPFVPPSAGGRIWLGHASNVSSHYDTLDNLACVIAGRRRFTLYAPELIGRLYVGPIDHTLAGQPVSLAASSPPDPERFPRFEAVRDQALVVELEPGDALYLPKLWWHQVEATAPFNGLVNYWWDAFSAGPDAPYTTLLLAMIAIAERPPAERLAWRAWFDHYVFRGEGHPLAHLPADHHGLLGPLKDNYGKIRARVMHMLRGF